MPEIFRAKSGAGRRHPVVRCMMAQERIATALAHAVVVANGNFRDNLAMRGTPLRKITVVNNVPDPAVFDRGLFPHRPLNGHEHFTMIYPGTVAPRYGLEVAIRALPRLRRDIPGIRLKILAAPCPHLDEIRCLAGSLDVGDLLELPGPVSLAEVPWHLRQADLGIYPALSDPHMEIATPTKVLEYARMGLPILGSDLRIMRELLPCGAAMLFEPGNDEDFARCVLELQRHPERRQELVNRADEVFVRVHSWEEERDRYFRLLNDLTGNPKALPVASVAAGGGASVRIHR
jgi:glycosyltransferase involved in cell wall biosynthesis